MGALLGQGSLVRFIDQVECPDVAVDRHGSRYWVLGLLLSLFLQFAGRTSLNPLDADYCRDPGFVEDVRGVLLALLALFRGEMARGGTRDAVTLLEDRQRCEELLVLLSTRSSAVDMGALSRQPEVLQPQANAEESGVRPLSLLTWNIAGEALACTAPSSWSLKDKDHAVLSEILRWAPDVLALQECATAGRLSTLTSRGYVFVGAAPCHEGYVQLYFKLALAFESCLPSFHSSPLPAVCSILVHNGLRLFVAAVHLAPGGNGGDMRMRQMQALRSWQRSAKAETAVLLGDFSVRDVEVDTWCINLGLSESY